jgi:hypothetical protein
LTPGNEIDIYPFTPIGETFQGKARYHEICSHCQGFIRIHKGEPPDLINVNYLGFRLIKDEPT